MNTQILSQSRRLKTEYLQKRMEVIEQNSSTTLDKLRRYLPLLKKAKQCGSCLKEMAVTVAQIDRVLLEVNRKTHSANPHSKFLKEFNSQINNMKADLKNLKEFERGSFEATNRRVIEQTEVKMDQVETKINASLAKISKAIRDSQVKKEIKKEILSESPHICQLKGVIRESLDPLQEWMGFINQTLNAAVNRTAGDWLERMKSYLIYNGDTFAGEEAVIHKQLILLKQELQERGNQGMQFRDVSGQVSARVRGLRTALEGVEAYCKEQIERQVYQGKSEGVGQVQRLLRDFKQKWQERLNNIFNS